MKKFKDILVTTTSTIEGNRIIKYLKPVSAHVVTGTNLFSDFAASLSDVFGGRSQSYQRQLSSIYHEAIETLKRSAIEIGANCILGLKVDLDEISGKGKSMFMITATGTAVLIENNQKQEPESNEKLEIINYDKMLILRMRNKIKKSATDKTLKLDESVWEFITKNNVHEVASEVLELTKKLFASSDIFTEQKKSIYQNLLSYFAVVPIEISTNLIYQYYLDESNKSFSEFIFPLIKELSLFDHVILMKYLSDENIEIRKKSLQIVVNDKTYYSKEDIPVYESLISLIQSYFPKKVEYSSQKKLLSSKEKEIWICTCNQKNDIESIHCSSCSKDVYGFTMNEVNPETAINKLTENIDIIKNNVA